jgi:hypothetical protein
MRTTCRMFSICFDHLLRDSAGSASTRAHHDCLNLDIPCPLVLTVVTIFDIVNGQFGIGYSVYSPTWKIGRPRMGSGSQVNRMLILLDIEKLMTSTLMGLVANVTH